MCLLHIRYMYGWWGLFHCEGCLCKLLDLVFSCFISSHMITWSGSLCIYGWFFLGNIEEYSTPSFELACPKTIPRKILVRRSMVFSRVLWVEQLPACLPARGDLYLSLGLSCWAFVLLTGNTLGNWKSPVYPLAHLNADRLMPWLFKVMAVSRTDA